MVVMNSIKIYTRHHKSIYAQRNLVMQGRSINSASATRMDLGYFQRTLKPRSNGVNVWVIKTFRGMESCFYFVTGQEKDKAQALIWHLKAANKGLVQSQFRFRVCYAKGEDVQKDKVEAARFYSMVADQGYDYGHIYLAVMYTIGRCVVKDEVEAVNWYRKAADQGNPYGQIDPGAGKCSLAPAR
ncbi:hypothetical protein HDU93_003521 [Gonapodya sp. JEL0774]|nr:hypothetical protein HDU93_003521 [Gonapodya sp. JEL0774]